jgi:hypothetical protein
MTTRRAEDVPKKTLIVTPVQVRAAKLIMKIDARRGRESRPAIKAIANARRLRPDELHRESA